MRVRVEEAVFHDLLDIIVDQLAADLPQIVPLSQKALLVIHWASAYVLHDQHTGCRVFMVELGAADILDSLIVAGELLHIGGFLEEVHLLLRRGPQLVQNHVKIYNVLKTSDRRQDADRSL